MELPACSVAYLDQRMTSPMTSEESVKSIQDNIRALKTSFSISCEEAERSISPQSDGAYGMRFLSKLRQRAVEARAGFLRPVALISGASTVNRNIQSNCFKAGATDVVFEPVSAASVLLLFRKATGYFKQYLSQAPVLPTGKSERWDGHTMVSELARDIQTGGKINDLRTIDMGMAVLAPEEEQRLITAISCWDFAAHDFEENELLNAALIMLQHTLQTNPELEKWQISKDELMNFLLVTSKSYKSSDVVHYHNFRHACDVMQATFFFLTQMGVIIPLRSQPILIGPQSFAASLLRPVEALTILIAAIGHDVGHPGLNNKFLVYTNNPVALLYNDRTVLENYHCSAFSQILRRAWPMIHTDGFVRDLLIRCILATDMDHHVEYVDRLNDLEITETSLKQAGVDELPAMTPTNKQKHRDTVCYLLLKTADICNVAREFHIAKSWATILDREFSVQGDIEKELKIPSQLFNPAAHADALKLAEGQIGFMKALRPYFHAISKCMLLDFSEIEANIDHWTATISNTTTQKGDSNFGTYTGESSHQPHSSSLPSSSQLAPSAGPSTFEYRRGLHDVMQSPVVDDEELPQYVGCKPPGPETVAVRSTAGSSSSCDSDPGGAAQHGEVQETGKQLIEGVLGDEQAADATGSSRSAATISPVKRRMLRMKTTSMSALKMLTGQNKRA